METFNELRRLRAALKRSYMHAADQEDKETIKGAIIYVEDKIRDIGNQVTTGYQKDHWSTRSYLIFVISLIAGTCFLLFLLANANLK